MRIAVDGRVVQDRYHGIGRYTFEMVRELAARDIDTVVFYDPTASSRLSLQELGRSMTLVEFPAPVVSAAAQRLWPTMLSSASADVLLVPYHLAVPIVRPPLPVVSMVHDCIFERDPRLAPGRRWFTPAYRLATRVAMARSTVVATVSQSTQHDIRQYYGVNLPTDAVLPHGVGPQFFNRGNCSGASCTDAEVEGRYILHVGVHRPHKNHSVLVAAFAKLAEQDPSLTLVLVGEPDERFPQWVDSLLSKYDVMGRVLVLRNVEEERLLNLYRHAAVFAFPSIFEGFGLPVLEAMAAGIPVVASDADAVAEAAAGAALVTPALSIDDWAANLYRVLHDSHLARELVERGLMVARTQTWKLTCDLTLDLFNHVLR